MIQYCVITCREDKCELSSKLVVVTAFISGSKMVASVRSMVMTVVCVGAELTQPESAE